MIPPGNTIFFILLLKRRITHANDSRLHAIYDNTRLFGCYEYLYLTLKHKVKPRNIRGDFNSFLCLHKLHVVACKPVIACSVAVTDELCCPLLINRVIVLKNKMGSCFYYIKRILGSSFWLLWEMFYNPLFVQQRFINQ